MDAILTALKGNIWWIVAIVVLVALLVVVAVARIARSKPDDDTDFVAKIKTMILSLTMAKFIKFLLETACIVTIVVSGYYLSTSQDNIVYIGLTTDIAIGVAFLVIFEGLPETWANGLLLGTASFACAAVFGLIFGIPPSISDKSSNGADPNGSLSAATAILKAKDDALASAKTAHGVADKALNDAKAKLDPKAKPEELQKAQDDIDSKQKTSDAALSAQKTAQAELDVAQEEVNWWRATPEELHYELNAANDAAKEAKSELMKTQTTLTDDQSQLNDKQKQLDSEQKKTSTDQNAINRLTADILMLTTNIGSLHSNLETLSVDYEAKRTKAARIGQIADEGNRRKRALYGVNTNLTDISDWLTKIIVGVGLVQLSKIIGLLKSVSNYTAKGLIDTTTTDPAVRAPVALTIILYFIAVGFLSAYLLTRVWLPQLLENV